MEEGERRSALSDFAKRNFAGAKAHEER